MGCPLVRTPVISNPRAFIPREIRASTTQVMPTQYVSRAIVFTSIAALLELAVAKYIGRHRESTLAAAVGQFPITGRTRPSDFYSRLSVRYGRISAGISAGGTERHSTLKPPL